ncbi:hypothetical protein ACX2VI_004283, partial [Cronobacter dublinensis]
IPPIVLASTKNININDVKITSDTLNEIVANPSQLIILDGLQRTYSLIETYKNHKEHFDSLDEKYTLRIEIYLSIDDTGILYRMLTLNTGQTPMSLRHQLEILFSKYLGSEIENVNVIKDIDDASVKSISDYKFSDLIEGYNSFIELNELPMDRFDVLQSVRTIKFISDTKSNLMDFPKFVKSFNFIARKFDIQFPGWEYPEESQVDPELKIDSNPYGKFTYRIFNRSQTITGFGAALGELIKSKSINDLSSIDDLIDELIFSSDDLLKLNKYLDDIKIKSKKIGNGQRIFFKLFFKYLLDKDGETYLNVSQNLEKAHKRALAEV